MSVYRIINSIYISVIKHRILTIKRLGQKDINAIWHSIILHGADVDAEQNITPIQPNVTFLTIFLATILVETTGKTEFGC